MINMKKNLIFAEETNIIYLCNGSIGIYDKAAGTKTLYQSV